MHYFSGLFGYGTDAIKTLPVGTVLAKRYEILETPYIGKHKAVYKCRDKKGPTRELMLAHPVTAGDETAAAFSHEQETLRGLLHPRMVAVVEAGNDSKHGLFSVYEYLDGPTLAVTLRQERRLELERAIELFGQICNALSYLHKQGLLHGAVKANHIILSRTRAHRIEDVKLIDFTTTQPIGQPRQLASSKDWSELFQFVGNPSPEELKGQPLDERAEVYAVGCMLYKALTGRAAFNGTSAEEIGKKHLQEPVPPLSVAQPQARFSPKLEDCVAKMLAKSPSQRMSSVDDLILELKFAARHS